ncbi:AMP1 protein, partial [Myiagra hebetior]|nr:AMP1 protein [Myiagra hebetior]
MKILFLLFTLILLLVQGAAGSELSCQLRGGICFSKKCIAPSRAIGRCDGKRLCCKL